MARQYRFSAQGRDALWKQRCVFRTRGVRNVFRTRGVRSVLEACENSAACSVLEAFRRERQNRRVFDKTAEFLRNCGRMLCSVLEAFSSMPSPSDWALTRAQRVRARAVHWHCLASRRTRHVSAAAGGQAAAGPDPPCRVKG
jgi:hypothetical protein